MPVKRCGPLKLVKRKKEDNTNKNDENCYSSPTKKMKSLNSIKVIFKFFFKNKLLYFCSCNSIICMSYYLFICLI